MFKSTQHHHNRHLGYKLAGITIVMFGFGFALVPLYDLFCEVTGLNGKGVNQLAGAEQVTIDSNRWVNVEFLASTPATGNWVFQPTTTRLRVRPGKLYTVSYRALNPTGQPAVVRAVSSIAPGLAASHISKLECFCFQQQHFDPGEQRLMPVRFMVNSALPPEVGTVSIAYSLFNSLDAQ